jgi:hypothetical protein
MRLDPIHARVPLRRRPVVIVAARADDAEERGGPKCGKSDEAELKCFILVSNEEELV